MTRPSVAPADPADPPAAGLLEEAQDELERRYPDGDISAAAADDLRPPRGLLLVASVAGTPRGCVGLVFTDGGAEMRRLFVRAPSRRGGLGRVLVAAAERAARQRGAPRLRLETGLAQPEAIAFYERLGYTRVPCWPPYDAWAQSVCFERPLSGGGGPGLLR